MRYAIFTDIHANLEALETVLAKIDELAQKGTYRPDLVPGRSCGLRSKS